MPSPNPYRWLLYKETRELLVSKSFWLLLLAMAPLTGMSFNTILRDFAGIVTRNRLRRSGAVVVIVGKSLDEGLVDLETPDGKTLQRAEA